MKFFRLALVFALPAGLALACGDDDGNSPGFSGTPGGEQSNGGSAGSNGNAGSNGLSGSGNDTAGASNGSGGSGSLSGDATVQDICRRGCAKTEPLNCPGDEPDCEATCLQEAAAEQDNECRAEALAFASCVADRPTSDFFCGEGGTSEVRDDVCSAEALAVITCAFESGEGL